MAETEHGRIVAIRAEAQLSPLGLKRRGRSRNWLADHDLWLDVVCFEPSGFSKGSYCTVAIHWLWGPDPVLSLDHDFRRVGGFASFGDPANFASAIDAMAAEAASVIEFHRAALSSIERVADAQTADAEKYGGWSAFHAGVANGLAGRNSAADRYLGMLPTVGPNDPPFVADRAALAGRLRASLQDRQTFLGEIQPLLDRQRSFFKLPPYRLT